MTREEIEELKGLAASMGFYDDKNPCKRAVILGKAIQELKQEPNTNDLAQERYQDLIEYFGDEKVAKTILEDRKEFKAWLERLRWNVKRVDELARRLEQIKETPKNNLAVDCISRVDAIKAMQDKAKKLTNEDTINGLCGAVAILYEMPSVTPQSKKGHWKLVQRGKTIDVCCSNCEAVRIKAYAYNYTIDELNKEDIKDINECFGSAEMRFCPFCGADMRGEK